MMADDTPALPVKRDGFGFLVFVAGLAGIGTGLAAWGWLRGHRDERPAVETTPPAVTPPAVTTVVAMPVVPSAPSPSSTTATGSTTVGDTAPATPTASAAATTNSAPEETVLSIETIPARSAIFIDGAKVGVSPADLKVPKSNEAIRLELRHPGYVALREQIVPNVNQRLKLTLTAARSATSPGPSGTSSAAPYHKFE
jgi:hypothetical protein